MTKDVCPRYGKEDSPKCRQRKIVQRLKCAWQEDCPICGKEDCLNVNVSRKLFKYVPKQIVRMLQGKFSKMWQICLSNVHAMDVARKNVHDVARKIISIKRVDAKLGNSRMGGLIFRY